MPTALARSLTLAIAFLTLAGRPSAACTGDCDGDGSVAVNEAVRGVSIALGQSTVGACPAFDRNGSTTVTIDELLMAVNAVLLGCPGTPGPTATVTNTASVTATASRSSTASPTLMPTPTPTMNQPPVVATASIYRTFEGAEVRIALAADPEGGPVECSAEALPAGATLEAGELGWTPSGEQLGPQYVPFSCSDAAVPPGSASGQLAFKVLPLDPCSLPSCTPESGCTVALPPPDQLCCTEEVIPRVAEPRVECPAGRVVFIGRNVNGFGRLQNCDTMQVRIFEQSGAQFSFKVETRCLDLNNRIEVYARVETRRRLLVNSAARIFFAEAPDGFARPSLPVTFTVLGGGPFFDIEEDGEANVFVRLTDGVGVSVETSLRVRLRERRPADLPEADPTPTPS